MIDDDTERCHHSRGHDDGYGGDEEDEDADHAHGS